MYKKNINKWFVIIILAVFTITYIVPKPVVFAQEQANNAAENLVSEEFQKSIENVGANIAIIDSYAQYIKTKQLPKLDDLQSIDNSLKNHMQNNLKEAKDNANQWFDQVKPDMRLSIQQTIDFNTTFQHHHENILAAIDKKDVKKLQSEIEQLYQHIAASNKQVDYLIKNLITFRNNMNKDVTSFKNNANQLQINLATTNADIPLMRKQIAYYNDVINAANGKIAAGSLLCATGILCLAGGPMIKNAVDEKNDAEEQIANLEAKISGIEKEIAVLTDIQSKFTNMASTIDKAITSLQNMSNNWHIMGAKYSNLLDNVSVMEEQDFELLKEDLQIAKQSWNQLKQFADAINQGLNQNDVLDSAK